MPVFCTYCGTQFTRDEHLERHILTHTNIKPFKCLTCHMSFARRDLLQRHYTVHGKNQDSHDGIPTILMPKHPGRTPIACTNCARTKTKCDKKFPCSRCSQRNLKCILRPTRRASRNVNSVNAVTHMLANPEAESGKATSFEQSAVQTATPEGSNGNSPPSYPASDSSGRHTPQRSDSNPGQAQTPEPKQRDPSAVFFDQCSAATVTQGLANLMSPLQTPGTIVNGFMPSTALSGYEDFTVSRDGSDQASPRFIMDWSQLQFSPAQLDPLGPDMMMATSMTMNLDGITDASMLAMMPDFTQSMAALQTPMTTPRMSMSTCLSDLEIQQTALPLDTPPASSRHTSLSSEPGSGDLAAIIKAQDGWNCFRSAPVLPPSSCPRTAKLHLEKLEQSLKNQEGWNSWRPTWEVSADASADHLHVVPLQESSKDKLLAITQTFLHKALKTHKNSGVDATPVPDPSSTHSSFVLLPPIRVLTYFLRTYANTFERLFPMTSRGTLDINALLADPSTNDRASSLLTLMMLAAGALFVPSLDARWLQAGLTEACRISLFDLVDTNVSMASDHTVLHSALLFTTTAAWSGDKWHMNMAMGQRGMYSAMLRHSGALERDVLDQSSELQPRDVWTEWLEKEGKSRLVYSWVMLDQDLSLFYDSNPLFAVTELGAPMPDSDRLWHAKSASEWSTVFSQVHEFGGALPSAGYGARPMSLRDLFRHFMEDDIIPRGMELTPLHLRLLLHPLQTLVGQHRQLSSCFSDPTSSSSRQQNGASSNVHAASVRARADELKALLARWQRLADRYLASHPSCATMDASLIVFHLVSLNAAVNFPEVERLARGEGFDGSLAQLAWRRKRCVNDAEEAAFHAGQVLRLLRGMPAGVRPPWWAGAVYRAALVFWVESLLRSRGGQASMSPLSAGQQPLVAIDALSPDHPLLVRFRSSKRDGGTPVLARSDGSHLAIDNEFAVLAHCVDIIDEGVANRFSDGIRNKLERLARGS